MRVDAGVAESETVSAGFDPMIAKIIVTAQDRTQAIARSRRVLGELVLEGLATPVEFYRDIIADATFARARHHTAWLEESFLPRWTASHPARHRGNTPDPIAQLRTVVIEVNGKRTELKVPADLFGGGVGEAARVPLHRAAQRIRNVARKVQNTRTARPASGQVPSPVQGIVVRHAVAPGDVVAEGDLLMVVEAMKMENYVSAPIAGTVTDIVAAVGQTVDKDAPLLVISATTDAPAELKEA